MKFHSQKPNQQSISILSGAYILLGVQGGFFVITLPNLLGNEAGKISWLFLLLTGAWILFIMVGLAKLVGARGMSWKELNQAAFGRIAGFAIGALWFLSLLFTNAYNIQKYIRLLNLYDFPNTQPLLYTILMTLAALFAVRGGLHTISGIFMISFSLQMLLILISFISVIPFIEFKYITPFTRIEMDHPIRAIIYSFAGFSGLETGALLMHAMKKENKLGNVRMIAWISVIALVLQLLLVEICMSIYGFELLKSTQFPTINMMRLVKLPFIEQVDQFAVGLLFLRFLPIVSLYLWSCTELFRNFAFQSVPYRIHQLLQGTVLLAVGFILMNIQLTKQIDMLVLFISAGWFVIYAPLLLLLAWLRTRKRK